MFNLFKHKQKEPQEEKGPDVARTVKDAIERSKGKEFFSVIWHDVNLAGYLLRGTHPSPDDILIYYICALEARISELEDRNVR